MKQLNTAFAETSFSLVSGVDQRPGYNYSSVFDVFSSQLYFMFIICPFIFVSVRRVNLPCQLKIRVMAGKIKRHMY